MTAPALLPTPVPIRRVARETADTFTLWLDAPEGFRYLPGQFNMLYPFGRGEVPISISGDADAPGALVHTIRAVGSVTHPMRRLRRGDVVGVRGPYGTAWPVEEAKGHDVVIVAGGIGLAPLRPVIYHVLRHRDQYDRLVILYGARTPADMLFVRELERWRARFDVSLHVTVDRAEPTWRGHVGVVTTLFERVTFDPVETIGMVCGPEVMMRFTVREFQKRGLDADQIYVSMERNMKCAVGFCGHCQYGPHFICKDGPVFRFDRIADQFSVREL